MPPYQRGNCLSVRLDSVFFTDAIVLRSHHSDVECGTNLIAVLDHIKAVEPSREVFEGRKWLVLTHHSSNNKPDVAWYVPRGHRKVKDKIKVVGKTEIREQDPSDSDRYTMWTRFGHHVELQRAWTRDGAVLKEN